jgi:hypothetical protein
MITDMSEAQLITLIRDKNFQAVQLWLKSHHPKYGNRLEVTGNFQQAQDKLTPEQETTVREALRLAGALSPEKPGEEKILLNESKKL